MRIKNAIISVYDKHQVVELATFLVEKGINIISTSNTYKHLKSAGIKVQEISEYTNFPEILGGRVKTLHPKVHGGILSTRSLDSSETDNLGIEPIDLVIVNLYPFWQTVNNANSSKSEIIEQIDIGGITLLRAAAKNFQYVTVIHDIDDYASLKQQITSSHETTLEYRQYLATKAFAITSIYDANIYNWLLSQQDQKCLPNYFILAGTKLQDLRSGENPHQKSAFYGNENYPMQTFHGKELSYNNIVDIESAIKIINEFDEQPAAVIIKHTNPCGAAIGNTIENAYDKALKCDERSSFGGILALNKPINVHLAQKIVQNFFEVIILPTIDDQILDILKSKKNLRIILSNYNTNKYDIKNVSNGFLLQEQNNYQLKDSDLSTVTIKSPTPQELQDLLFAWKICKHVKSNAIVIVKDGCTIGIGAGQMSRIDSVNIAITKAQNCKNSVLASDAFFPFPDSIIQCAEHGISAIIQPGGSIKDKEVIKVANEKEIAMIFTNIRNFLH